MKSCIQILSTPMHFIHFHLHSLSLGPCSGCRKLLLTQGPTEAEIFAVTAVRLTPVLCNIFPLHSLNGFAVHLFRL